MHKWIRVHLDVYKQLTDLLVYMQFVKRRKLTYGDVVRELVESYIRSHIQEIRTYIGDR